MTAAGPTMEVVIHWENGDGESSETVPACFAVCPCCKGSGRTLARSLRGSFTEDEFERCFDTDEAREEYMKGGAGVYGVTCERCGGLRVVGAPDTARANKRQLRVIRRWLAQQRNAEEGRREAFHEMRREALMLGEGSLSEWEDF